MRARRAGVLFAGSLVLLAAAVPVRAQLVHGRVIEEGSQRPIEAAAIELIDSAGARRARVASDTAGTFRVLAPLPGIYRVRVSRIGYATLETAPLSAGLGVSLELELKLNPAAVALEPVRVTARTVYAMGRLQEYYERAMWTQRTGLGRVLTRDELERLQLPSPSAALVYLQPRAGCVPTYFLDGVVVPDRRELDARLNPQDIEGVELYNNSTQLPREYDCCGRCAVALYWTRRDIEDPRPPSFKRLVFAAALIAGVILFAWKL